MDRRGAAAARGPRRGRARVGSAACGSAAKGGEALLLRARFALPSGTSFADLDPRAEGARLTLVSPGGTEADLAFPSGAYGGDGTIGWQRGAGGGRWSYHDTTATGLPTRALLTIRDEGDGKPAGSVGVHAVVRRAFLPVRDTDLPLQAIVVLGNEAAGAAGRCAQSRFGPARCSVGGGGERIDCRVLLG
jgi:hypothetical protein